MNLAKNIITVLLALLLANPACCCALKGCGSNDDAPVRSCCSGPSDDQNGDQDSPDDDHKCMCSVNKQFTEQAAIDLPDSHLASLPVPTVIILPVDALEPPLVIDLPQAIHDPPGVSLRVLYSVFRL